MPEWKKYKFTIPKNKSDWSDDGKHLSTVYHIVHLPQARRILEDGHLKARLVSDESRLKRSRICVTWLSANTWVNGSFYGNVQFAFDWADIIEGRDIYWVEAIAYSPPAYRFLITNRDMSRYQHVIPYDPEEHEGPLRKRGEEWYWNTKCTSEFMIDDDISLKDCTGLSFVSHHSTSCRTFRSSCAYMHDTQQETAGRLLAFLLSSDSNRRARELIRESQDGTVRLSFEAKSGVEGIWRALGNKEEEFGGAIKRAQSRRAVLLGALKLYGAEQDQAARELVALLSSQEVFEKALVDIVRKKSGIAEYELEN